MTAISHGNQCTFLFITRSVLLRMKNFSGQTLQRNSKNTLLHPVTFFLKIIVFIKKCGKYIVELERPRMTQRMRFARQIPKDTDTHSEYVSIFTTTIIMRTRFDVTLIRTSYKSGQGAVLQIGRSLVRSQLVSLEFFIDIKSFRSHYGPGVDSASNKNEYQGYFLEVKTAAS